MPFRAKALIAAVIAAGILSFCLSARHPGRQWIVFSVFLTAALLSSSLKVKRLSGSGSMSLNYLFIFISILQLSVLQSCIIAALSVAAQCRIRKLAWFPVVQVVFNVANATYSTACATALYRLLLSFTMPEALSIVVAATLYFLCNTLPVAFAIAWSQDKSAAGLWKQEFRWFLPFYLVGAALAVAASLMSVRFGWATAALLLPIAYTLYRAYNAQVEQWEERKRHLDETEALHLRTIEGLAMAIEAKDHNTHDHLFRVRDYVTDIATTMGLSEADKKALQIAAFLHDIGKLAVPEHIINKPGKLTSEEFEKMKIHPSVGADILERVRFPYPVVPIVKSHHERWDGLGYPEGLRGEAIPLGARILSVVDCFDALASDRPYRRAMPLEKAMEIVKGSAGTQFDPEVVRILETRYLVLEQTLRDKEEPSRSQFVALNVDVQIERGAAPGAGLASGGPQTENITEEQLAVTPERTLRLIAAASHEAQTIFEMSQDAGSLTSVTGAAWMMENRLRALLPLDCFALYLRQGDEVRCQYLTEEYAAAFRPEPVALGEGISGWVAQSGLPILNGNATVEPTYCGTAAAATMLLTATAVPLRDLHDNVFGVVTLYTAQADTFTRDHLRMVQAVESKFALAVGNALRSRRIHCEADLDTLTQLPNTWHLVRELETEVSHCKRSGCNLAVLVFDLDFFHALNDREGYAAGNGLLQALGQELPKRCRTSDTVARLGSDEFAILLRGTGAEFLQSQPQWLQAGLAAACDRAGVTREITASVGSAVYPVDGNSAEALLASATRRMYLQKAKQHQAVAETRVLEAA